MTKRRRRLTEAAERVQSASAKLNNQFLRFDKYDAALRQAQGLAGVLANNTDLVTAVREVADTEILLKEEQILAWLTKKAHEYGSTLDTDDMVRSQVLHEMVSKIRRGAIQ